MKKSNKSIWIGAIIGLIVSIPIMSLIYYTESFICPDKLVEENNGKCINNEPLSWTGWYCRGNNLYDPENHCISNFLLFGGGTGDIADIMLLPFVFIESLIFGALVGLVIYLIKRKKK